ncbi:S9 family peptidase [Bacteroidales bacterium OttesenSCG-928-K03]|nr:S9 family peptidase [Odoribacter sp. OttesenSCG-928-L07]MDL2242684.1 S9 family peptidase [Bacteroidales bacterium OttesenSCG-928-K03]
MRKISTFLILLLSSMFLFAQEKTFTLEDCIYMNRELFPKNIQNLQWIPETSDYSFVKDNALISNNAKSNKEKTLLTLEELNSAAENSEFEISFSNRFPSISWTDKNVFSFSVMNDIYSFKLSNKEITKLDTRPEGENLDKGNSYIYAYTDGADLYISKNGENTCIAKSEKEGVSYGPDGVHRSEFGISKGTFWSPNDNFLAFYRLDESMVADYPLVDITKRIAAVENTKYPMAGMTSHEATLGVYNVNTGKIVYMKTGDPVNQYLTSVTWDPSEKYIYIAVLNRDQNHLKLNKYDVATGDLIKTLFEETDEQYVEPQNPLAFISKDKNKFIWQSRRDGWNHLYLYNTDGNLIKQLTKGNWEVTEIIDFNKNEDIIYVMGTYDSPIENNLYAVKTKDQSIKRLTNIHGTHYCYLSPNKDYFIDNYSNTETTRVINIVDINGKIAKTLQEDANPLKDYKQCEIIVGTLKSDNNDDLYYRMILPSDFDPNKKYPVFYYVYGGPHMQMVTDSWNAGAGFWDLRWAQRGYIVFSMDNRGTPNRGEAFEDCIHRNLGVLEVDDQMKGVEYLRSLPYVDTDRMSVDGWSYGGFMTTSLMLKQPDVFKVGVAGGPVIQWEFYEIMYGERYMDTPESNPDGYKNGNLINYVDNLKGKLMLIHCTTDPVVVWQHSLSFIDACIKARKQVDYFVYPGHEHNVRGIDRAHLYEKIENYIDDNLK